MAKEKQKDLTRLVVTELGLRIPNFSTGIEVTAIPIGGPKLLYRGKTCIVSSAPKTANAYVQGEQKGKQFTVQYYSIPNGL